MVLKLRLVLFPSEGDQEKVTHSPFTLWKKYYRPPWVFLCHIIQVILILWIYFVLVNPTVTKLYIIRKMFLTLMFPDTDDSIPFASIQELQTAIDTFLDNIDAVLKNSFQYMYFTNPDYPIVFHIHWQNGSVSTYTTLDINIDLFRHIKSFDLSCTFMLIDTDGTYTGCTQWELIFNVKVALGSYFFYLEPTFNRHVCSNSVVSNYDRNLVYPSSFKRLNSNNLKYGPMPKMFDHNHSNIRIKAQAEIPTYDSNPSTLPHFKRQNLYFYHMFVKFGSLLLIISFVDMITIWLQLIKSFIKHRYLLKTNPEYGDLDPYEQFHSTIGFWTPIFVLTEIVMVVMSIVFLADSQTITQYLPKSSTFLYGISSLLLITTTVRWLHAYPPCYALVFIIRQAFIKLMLIVIGIAPIVLALVFVSIFLFGFVGEITESMVILVETLLSVTFGDMINDFYAAFTDGTLLYNILSFIYATISVAIVMWLFFTSFTAQMTSLYAEQISSLVDNDSSSDSESI